MSRSRLRSAPARPSRPVEPGGRTRRAADRATARPTPRAAEAPDGADDADGSTLPTLDGRRRHPVDRALDFRALERAGLSGAQIARRRRKSAGYVSVLLRLGRALEPLEPAEQAAFRSPRVTIGLIQRIVRVGVPDAELRAQLRAAVSGVSRHNVDRRRGRERRPADAAGEAPGVAIGAGRVAGASGAADGPERPSNRAADRIGARDGRGSAPTGGRAVAGLAGWAWDQALWEADPEGYVADLLARVVGLQQTVLARAQRAVRDGGALRVDAGQSLGQLARRLGGRATARTAAGEVPPPPAGATPAERRALAALGIWGAGLLAASDGARRSLGVAGRGEGSRGKDPAGPPPPGGTVPQPATPPPATVRTALTDPIGWSEVEDDLADG